MSESILLIINLIILLLTINNKYMIDDIRNIIRIREERVCRLSRIFTYLRNRLYGCGTLNINKLGESTNLIIDNIFRCFLNFTVSILIYKALGSNNISLWASILYSVNPANNQTILWHNARRYTINIILVLFAYSIGTIGILLYPLMPFFQFNALFSPIILLNHCISLIVIPIFFYIGNRYILRWYEARKSMIPKGEYITYKPRRIIVIIKTFGIYITKMLFPMKILFYSDKLYFWGINNEGNKNAYKINADFYIGAICIILCAIIGWGIHKEYLSIYIFMLVATLQWCNVITVTQTIADRYVSLPNVFMMFFLSYFINTYAGQHSNNILISIFILYSYGLFISMRMYRSLNDFYEYHIYNNKKDISCRIFKATDCMMNGDFMRAFIILKEGLHYVPNDFKLLFQLACCSYKLGDKKLCLDLLNKAENNYYIGQEEDLSKKVLSVREAIKKQMGTS